MRERTIIFIFAKKMKEVGETLEENNLMCGSSS